MSGHVAHMEETDSVRTCSTYGRNRFWIETSRETSRVEDRCLNVRGMYNKFGFRGRLRGFEVEYNGSGYGPIANLWADDEGTMKCSTSVEVYSNGA
jgi:hypothetical protein